jgi:hypothetical protein
MAHTATQYLANSLQFNRGTAADVIRVGAFYADNPNLVPEVTDFYNSILVKPGDPLAEGNLTDILTRVGARPDAQVTLSAGDYQVWLLVVTTDEDIIFKMDTLELL